MVCQPTIQQSTVSSHHTTSSGSDIILVVDDSPDNLFLTESILAEDGYEVICVEDGASALSLMESLTPDLVLLDVMMPGIDGYEVTRRIRARHYSSYIPILLVTAHDQPCVVDGLDAGADDFIRKPIVEVDELLARVRSLLRLKHTIDERDQIARQREDFVSRLTHDLRTPLIAADRMLTMINQGTFGEVAGPIHESIATVIRNNENLLAMVNTWLEVYRHEAGSKSLTFSRFNLCRLVDEVVGELAPLASQKDIELLQRYGWEESEEPSEAFSSTRDADGSHADGHCHNKEDNRKPSFRILGDRLELRRVLTNIVSNAIKFTDAGTVKVVVEFVDADTCDRINIDDSDDDVPGRWVLIHVQDSGSGISEEDQAQIFERFRQGRNKRAGNGLGLHLSRRIIDAHGGSIQVSSNLGAGSTFTIQLPVSHKKTEQR